MYVSSVAGKTCDVLSSRSSCTLIDFFMPCCTWMRTCKGNRLIGAYIPPKDEVDGALVLDLKDRYELRQHGLPVSLAYRRVPRNMACMCRIFSEPCIEANVQHADYARNPSRRSLSLCHTSFTKGLQDIATALELIKLKCRHFALPSS